MSGKVLIRESIHTINGREYVFQYTTGTVADPDTMHISVREEDDDTHILIFKGDYKAYELFCVIANEYRGM
jgi:hypothetical protein